MKQITLHCRPELLKGWLRDIKENPQSFLMLLGPEQLGEIVEDAIAAHQLQALINTPHTSDFLEATRIEAAHQVARWGDAHDGKKSAENWFWLVGYLAGKCLRACIAGDRDKALHHTISSAAALLNWHRAISLDTSGCGAGEDADIKPVETTAAATNRELPLHARRPHLGQAQRVPAGRHDAGAVRRHRARTRARRDPDPRTLWRERMNVGEFPNEGRGSEECRASSEAVVRQVLQNAVGRLLLALVLLVLACVVADLIEVPFEAFVQAAASIFGVIGTLLLATRTRVAGWGFMAFLASNAGWLWFSHEHGFQWMFWQQVAFTVSSLVGVWVWLVKGRS